MSGSVRILATPEQAARLARALDVYAEQCDELMESLRAAKERDVIRGWLLALVEA